VLAPWLLGFVGEAPGRPTTTTWVMHDIVGTLDN
jgi:hypothetical protein